MFHDHLRPQYSNTMDNIIRFKNQDFISLRNQCLRSGRLFEDDMFPANNSAIGQRLLKEKDIESPKWKRPKELLGTEFPHFILDGISKFDIRQGKAGDCWFLAALGSLTHKPKLLAKIIPTNQSFTAGYAGIFHFQFWQCGQWVDVVVDDRLPVESIHTKYLFVYPRRGNNEFWPCLLEKAYAKLHGSYSQLHYGYTIDSLVELTGWVVTKVNLKEVHPNLFKNLKVAEQSGSLITCGIADPSNMVEKFGLVNNHAYTVTGSAKISLDSRQEELIRLWNPWGEKEWTGRWSDNSREWQKVQESERTRLYKNKEDGEFWMSFLDFQKTFNSMLICFQYPMVMNDRNLRNGVWSILDKDQKIQRNIMQDSSSDALGNTLQYVFSVKEPMEGINVVVSINIQPQQDRKKMPLFEVYKVEHQSSVLHKSLNPMYFEFASPIQGKNVMSKWNYTESFHLDSGTYVVVPITEEGLNFYLQIFLKHQDVNRDLHESFKFMTFKENLPQVQYHESIFIRYAQQGPDIDASQLQSLLNKEFLKSNYSEPLERTFTFDECRSILALMDVKVNGRLDLKEFGQLWKKLIRYQGIFQKVEKNGSGFLMGWDLWKVIRESGPSINSELLDLMAIRYGNGDGKIYFADVICFLIRLEIMSRAFRNLSKDGKGLYLTETEWIKFTMYC